MRVLLINLARLGDLLQSQALISGLHAAGHEVDLLCLDNFADAASALAHVRKVRPFAGARVLAALERSWPDALLELREFVRGVGPVDRVVNLTSHLPARLLARLVNGGGLLGFGIDASGYRQNHGVWSSLLQLSSQKRASSPFNVADLFRLVGRPLLRSLPEPSLEFCGLAGPPREATDFAREFLSQASRARGFAAFQLGASQVRRMWPAAHFARVGDMLAKDGFCPVLLGTEAELPLVEEYRACARHEFLAAAGKTDISRLAALLRRCSLLITNDTGTMHLASGLGTPVLAFFLATAQPWDTGPYLPGAVCLEPALACHPCGFGAPCGEGHACRSAIGPDGVGRLASDYLAGAGWQVPSALAAEARVWRTGVSDGLACLESLSGHGAEERANWLAWQRVFWRQLLDHLDGLTAPRADWPAKAPALAASAAPKLAACAQLLESLGGALELAARNTRAGSIFLRGTRQVQSILDACRPLSTLGAFFGEYMEQADIPSLGPAMTTMAACMRGFGERLLEAGRQ